MVPNRAMVPARNYLFKINYGDIRTMDEVCSKLTITTPELGQ